jgi:hypothetical protein
MKSALLLTCLIVTACSVTPASRSGSANPTPMIAASDPFPVPKSGMTIPGSDKTPLMDVVTEFERVTGIRAVIMADTRAMLMKLPTGLTEPLDVPASRVYSTVETMLAESGFVITLLQAEPPILVGIATIVQGGRQGKPLTPANVDLDVAAKHPALLTTLVVTLPHTNVRDLSNSMRQMFQDPQSQQIIPVGNSNSILLTGRGGEVAKIARMLLEVDAAEARNQAEDANRVAPSGSVEKKESQPK